MAQILQTTYELIQAHPDSHIVKLFLGRKSLWHVDHRTLTWNIVNGEALFKYARNRFGDVAGVIRLSGEIPVVNLPQENTLHISCYVLSGAKAITIPPSTPDGFCIFQKPPEEYVTLSGGLVEYIYPPVYKAEFLYVSPKFFPEGFLEQNASPLPALEKDYLNYKHGLAAVPAAHPLLDSPIPTSPSKQQINWTTLIYIDLKILAIFV